jgi:hypothetical protein
VLADTPRAYWRLGESLGSTAADETGTVSGTYLSGVTLGAASALATDANTSAAFDGGDDKITMGDPSGGELDFDLGDFSAEGWVRATANDERAIFSKRQVGTGLPFWQATVSDDGSRTGRVRVNLSDGVTSAEVYGPAIRVDDGNWHHVVVVFDRDAAIVVYVDGVAQTNLVTVAGSVSNAGEFLVGKSTGYPFFKGGLDEIAVYPTALSAERVQAHYTAGRG